MLHTRLIMEPFKPPKIVAELWIKVKSHSYKMNVFTVQIPVEHKQRCTYWYTYDVI